MPFICLVQSSYFRSRQLRGKQNIIPGICFSFYYITFFFTHFLSFDSYGGERYEKRELQIRVRQRFAELQSIDEEQGRVPWHVVDASQSIEEVRKKLSKIVSDTIERVDRNSAPLHRMWADGEYELPTPKAMTEDGEKGEEKKEH